MSSECQVNDSTSSASAPNICLYALAAARVPGLYIMIFSNRTSFSIALIRFHIAALVMNGIIPQTVNYHAKCAKALLASAMRCVVSFFVSTDLPYVYNAQFALQSLVY